MGVCASKGKAGEKYHRGVYFDDEEDPRPEGDKFIPDEELQKRLKKVIGKNERILKVCVYKCKLFSVQLTAGTLYHAFVVLETKNWWWSIEKNGQGVTIQRSKRHTSVCEKYRMKSRNTVSGPIAEDTCRYNLHQFVDMLYASDAVGGAYHLLENNCQMFASVVYNEAASSEYWYPKV